MLVYSQLVYLPPVSIFPMFVHLHYFFHHWPWKAQLGEWSIKVFTLTLTSTLAQWHWHWDWHWHRLWHWHWLWHLHGHFISVFFVPLDNGFWTPLETSALTRQVRNWKGVIATSTNCSICKYDAKTSSSYPSTEPSRVIADQSMLRRGLFATWKKLTAFGQLKLR